MSNDPGSPATVSDCLKFLKWIEARLLLAGRGDGVATSATDPAGRFWLGRLAPEVGSSGGADRIGRMEPCAIGIRLLPAENGPWTCRARVRFRAWIPDGSNWVKSSEVDEIIDLLIVGKFQQVFGADRLTNALKAVTGFDGFSAELRVEVTPGPRGAPELLIQIVNTSQVQAKRLKDSRLYEASLSIEGLAVNPFMLEALPDSFRYDRRVWAYGVNCGITSDEGRFTTTDTVGAQKLRPDYWGMGLPGLKFETLESNPFPELDSLVGALRSWGIEAWSVSSLDQRAAKHHWSTEMRAEAAEEARKFGVELDRIENGVAHLRRDANLAKAFRLMNRAMSRASRGRGYDSWRPFQVGFILANLACILEPTEESGIVDIVWFATGGGKTETYLGLLITAVLFDRMRGKSHGVTAWTRFPLRMLSLQQLQRFADAMAAAEMVRREEKIGGSTFASGFLVGDSATPNRILPTPRYDGDIDVENDDERSLARYKRLQKCPFCGAREIEMAFDRELWRLDHKCLNSKCPWPEAALPFHVVDEEIYRFLPTIVVGTLDKAAGIGMQGAMRGLAGPPLGMCKRTGHGFTYSPRSERPHGCFVPGCKQAAGPLPMAPELFGPSYRLQDELHLLRDSLGAVDAHYEALFDGLQAELCGYRPKILASSATLEGYETQVDVLYRRQGRVFPMQGPSTEEGFWTSASTEVMRHYVAIAPRGLTIEFVIDRMATEMQNAVRSLLTDPDRVCEEVGVDAAKAPSLLQLYGTQVIYGNTLRDLDAIQRSIQSGQIRPENGKRLNHEVLTGRTDFKDVAKILERLEKPESEFEDRVHLITASSMMSHGVDIDRLNVMVMAGLPLGSAEFIQATARVGRRYPGIVFVIHKIGRERDASIFRSFDKFVSQGDRFIEPIPITRKSRRVLERTIPGLELARILTIHEPRAGKSLYMVSALRALATSGAFDIGKEREAVMGYLGITAADDPKLAEDLERWFDRFEQNIIRPHPDIKSGSDAAGKPMISLRDVEEQVPVYLDRSS